MIDWQAKLESLKGLKPGWDSYDAPPPTSEALEFAFYLLDREHPGREFLKRVSPCVQGGIGMMFRNPDYGRARKVYLEIGQCGTAAAMFLSDEKIETFAVEDDFEWREKFYDRMSQFMINGESI